jgi:peptidoglycan/LPS O-acetylase OafA/YrhL
MVTITPKTPVDRTSTAKGTIQDIETLRALSIILVLIAHAEFFFPWPDAVFRVTSQFKFGIGVDLFFVISGYVISRSLWRDLQSRESALATLKAFWIRRFFRLWPAAAVVILATVGVIALTPDTSMYSRYGDIQSHFNAAVAALAYWMNLWGYHRVSSGQGVTLLGHFWSLSIEEQFYLLFPLVVLTVRTKRALAICAIAAILGFSFLDRSFLRLWWWIRIDGLAWGVLIFFLQSGGVGIPKRLQGGKIAGLIALAIGVVGMLGSEKLFGNGPLASTVSTAGAALLVYIASLDQNYFQFRNKLSVVLNYLGSRSYTIYLWHLLIYVVVQKAWKVAFPGLMAQPSYSMGVAMALSLVPCIVLIELVFRSVEIPTRDFGKRLSLRF